MVSGASVWPMKMLAATLSDSAPLAPMIFCIADGEALHDPLHDAEVIEDREKRGDEDDDGQNLESENGAELSRSTVPEYRQTGMTRPPPSSRAWR